MRITPTGSSIWMLGTRLEGAGNVTPSLMRGKSALYLLSHSPVHLCKSPHHNSLTQLLSGKWATEACNTRGGTLENNSLEVFPVSDVILSLLVVVGDFCCGGVRHCFPRSSSEADVINSPIRILSRLPSSMPFPSHRPHGNLTGQEKKKFFWFKIFWIYFCCCCELTLVSRDPMNLHF